MKNEHRRFVLSQALAWATVLLCVIPASLCAQTVGGTILGVVQDQQGAVIAKAEISARSLDTGAIRKTVSEDNGEYRIPSLPAGAYEISVTTPGFKTEVRSGIVVTVGADVGVNFAMTVGAITDKVEVTGEAAQVDTSSSTMGGFVSSATIRELPLNGRDWLQLTLLQPGALQNAGEYQSDTSRAQRGNGLAISISGGRIVENVFRIDGLVVNDYANAGPGSSLHVNMGVDAIREFSVLTNNYSAEYGRGASGVVNAITKSGTNDFHGSAYYFHRNSALDARNFFDGATIAPFRRHQYGGSIGGPIRKDKTFFFSNYEALTELKGQSTSYDTLSANAHNGILCANTQCTSTTQVTVDPRVKPYVAIYPLPNGQVTGDTGKFAFDAKRLGDEKYVIGKIDHYFSPATTLYGHYSYDNTTVTSPSPYGQKLTGAPARKQNFVLSLQHLFTPSLINNTRLGVTRTYAGNNIDCCVTLPALSDLSLSFVPGVPVGTFNVTGISSPVSLWGGIGQGGLNNFWYTAPQFYNDLSWTKGRHSIRTGFAFERVLDNLDERNRPNGLWTFPSIAAMLQVQPTQFSAQFPGTDGIRGLRNSIFGGYVQDDFRIRPNFTLNLGVRYDMSTVIKEVNGKLGNLRNITDAKVTPGDPYYNNPTFKNFAPRVGFAWDPFKDGKTAIRGGVGMFDIIPLPHVFVSIVPRSAPYYLEGSVTNTTAVPLAPAFPGNALSLLSLTTIQGTHIEFNPDRAYKMQWNMNIQRQLTRSMALTVGYVGSAGVHLTHTIYDSNQVPPSLVKIVDSHFVFPVPATGQAIQRINPNFGQIRTTDWLGHSSYHSLQTNLVQRLTKGLTYQVAYTWSKSIDDGTNTTSDGENLNTVGQPWAFCVRCNRGPSDFDITHNFVVNFQYDIPVPASVKSHALSNTVLGGWQVGGIYTRQTGGSYNIKITTDRAFTGSSIVGASQGGQRPNYLGNLPGCSPAEVTTGDIGHLIKTSCFAFPAPGELGNLGRDIFRMPVFRNLDFSVFKNQHLRGERLNMQFRAEMFNILNNTNLTGQTFTNTFTGTGALVASFGTPTAPTYNQSRQIQFGLRFLF
jgi:hypothetical protein